MSRDYSPQQEHNLLTNLLSDDDLPSSTHSLKDEEHQHRSNSFSAPPDLFDFAYGNYEEEDPELAPFIEGKNVIRKNSEISNNLPLPINTRKMSLQFDDYSFQNNTYFMNRMPYYCSTPQQELLANIHQVCNLAKDQYGSRTVQNVLDNSDRATQSAIYQIIMQEASGLITDRFGNYVFQKFFHVCDYYQKIQIFKIMKQRLVEISKDCYGCRVVQKLIQFLQNQAELQLELIEILEKEALDLIRNPNANHVIQKCFQIFNIKKMNKIVTIIISNLEQLALHAYGCRVLQKYLQNAKGEEHEDKILSLLLRNAIQLSQCQYGNYVMQHIVMKCPSKHAEILKIFEKDFILLSLNKFASNVMQKVIKNSPKKQIDQLTLILLQSNNLIKLAGHQYGNYVVQSLLENSSAEKKQQLKNKIIEHEVEIEKSQHGKHVLLQLERL